MNIWNQSYVWIADERIKENDLQSYAVTLKAAVRIEITGAINV